MSLRAKIAALAVIAAFLAQPVLGAAVCWQMGAATGSCDTPCPMDEQTLPAPAKVKPTDSSCCQISAAEPVTLTSLVASPGAAFAALPAPLELKGLT
ncbi:MAG: hypothetical protein ACRESV_10195, partial [Nevskiales bacterium]